jgi:hypothetical protein
MVTMFTDQKQLMAGSAVKFTDKLLSTKFIYRAAVYQLMLKQIMLFFLVFQDIFGIFRCISEFQTSCVFRDFSRNP